MTPDSLIAEVRPLFVDEGRSDDEIRRWLLEAAAIAAYNDRRIGHGGVGRMLGLGWAETERFLIDHKVERNYADADAEHDLAFIEQTRATSA